VAWALACQDNGWRIADLKLIELLQKIWNATYGDSVPHEITLNDSVFQVVRDIIILFTILTFDHLQTTQRISDTWRSRLGSTAISVVNAYFDSKPKKYGTDESRQAFAKSALKNLAFLYAVTKPPKEPSVSQLSKYLNTA
jgi:hypothetical protein